MLLLEISYQKKHKLEKTPKKISVVYECGSVQG